MLICVVNTMIPCLLCKLLYQSFVRLFRIALTPAKDNTKHKSAEFFVSDF